MTNNKPLKCWDCKHLGKCQKLKPCKAFRRYNYPTVGAPAREYTETKVAELCGISRGTLSRRLRLNETATLAMVRERTGLRLQRVLRNSRHVLVKEAKA